MLNVNDTQKIILAYLFGKENVSHATLSEVTRISKPGITQTVQPMLKEGMLVKTSLAKTGKVGRREDLLSLNPNYGSFLGIDVRKHNFYLSCIDYAGNPLGTVCCHDKTELVDAIWDTLSSHSPCLGAAVTIRGFTTMERYRKTGGDFVSLMQSFHLPLSFHNNVEALAYVHKLCNPEDKTFLLIKYGPGVGSSIFVNGKPVGPQSEFGKMYLGDKQIEDIISFDRLFAEELEEKEATERILKDPDKIAIVTKSLAKGLVNADALLSLDRVLFAGKVLTDDGVYNLLKKEMHEINPEINPDKGCLYENYDYLNEYKAALMALIEYSMVKGN